MSHPSNKAVFAAFQLFKEHLATSGYQESFNTYYRLGEYETGPMVTVTAADIHLHVKKVEGVNFWFFAYPDFPNVTLTGMNGFWRLVFFGLAGIPAGFHGNKEAEGWLLAHCT